MAKRIYERIRKMSYGGKYTQVKDAVRELLRLKQEVFMSLIRRPGLWAKRVFPTSFDPVNLYAVPYLHAALPPKDPDSF